MMKFKKNTHFNLFGIGAGPANLSLASLLYTKPEITNLFIDQKKKFSWHDDQMIEGATLQVSLFKDLCTLADPKNKFTFLSYLHEKGKIYHFLNAQFEEIPRREFRNYMAWAADKNENVNFDEEVLNIDFDGIFKIETNKRFFTADHLSIGVGTRPWVPDFASKLLGETQYHISQYMKKTKNIAGKHIAIIGGGQSGAEAFLDLLSKPKAERPKHISWISRRKNFLPIDDSSFTNDFYMPCYSDHFSQLSLNTRQTVNRANLLSSDGISESTLRQIYQKLYCFKFVDFDEISFDLLPNRSVEMVDSIGTVDWQLTYKHYDATNPEYLNVNEIIWATGYRPMEKKFLDSLKGRIKFENNEFIIDNNFSVMWDSSSTNNIFMQNSAHGQRSFPDVNLSLNAWRANRIISRLSGEKPNQQLASFISWSPKYNSEVNPKNIVPPLIKNEKSVSIK